MTKSLLRRENGEVPFKEKSAGMVQNGQSEPAAESARREYDPGIGRRKNGKDIVPEDELNPPLPPESMPDADSGEAEDFLKNDTILPWLGKTLRASLLLAASFAMFFIITQTASFLASVRQLSRIEQILLAIPMVIFGCIILWYLYKMLSLFWKLRVSPQIRLKALQALEERKTLRDLSLNAGHKAVEKLCRLLEDGRTYGSKDYPAALRKLEVPPDQIDELNNARLKLIENARNPRSASSDWLVDFREHFQIRLDEIAAKRIRKYYVHAGIMTGISPYPLFDRLIVLRACLGMLKDLLEIYALKPSWDKNLVLLAKVILNTYLAGFIDNAAESGMNLVMDNLPELTNVTLSKGLDLVIRKGGGKGAGMLAQAYMVYRLGNAAVKVLRPISMK